MIWIGKALPSLAGTLPTLFDSSQPAVIESDRPLRQVPRPEYAGMVRRDAQENRRGRQQPPGRQDSLPESFPCNQCRNDCKQQSKISKADVNRLIMGDTRFAIPETVCIFLRRPHNIEDTSGLPWVPDRRASWNMEFVPCK